ncbi:NAD(P)/FAD-dependent oxidoreductase [Saccharibacillus deserti]|uniref:NAD(P)/FAD-dependent oxidoreductase n=1 Tax=Saccharibacillus deserti TaxID=1634444 RepID=UPI001554D63C|nr:FAD-dependent oxidoreductase [Saccharibacillus deserti]
MNNPNEIPVIVVIGGGYAGLQTLLRLKKELRVHALKTGERQTVPNAAEVPGRGTTPERKGKAAQAKLILIDRNAAHLRKVLLFRGAVHPEKTKIPFANLARSDIGFLQADVLGIHASERQLELKRPDGRCETLAYDRLVVATGSVPRSGGEERGGFDLSNPEETDKIREALEALEVGGIRGIEGEEKPAGQRSALEAGSRSPQIIVVGGGLSGIEMAAELADELRRRLRERGLAAEHPAVTLIDSGERLLPQASAEVGERLERELRAAGVSLLHGRRAVRFAGGRLELEDGESLPADLCVWALGLQASPAAAKWGLPVDEVGRIVVDASLRIGGLDGCYAVGDCARIVDPATGRIEGMSCREGTSQAKWLAKAIRAGLEGRAEPAYRSAPLVLCASLGPARGFAWTRLQGRDIVLTGSLGLLARRYTWKLVDLLPD